MSFLLFINYLFISFPHVRIMHQSKPVYHVPVFDDFSIYFSGVFLCMGCDKLTNSCWQTQVGVSEQHKNSRQTRWQTVGDKENMPLFSPNLWRVNDWQIGIGMCQPIKTRTLFTWFICVAIHKMAWGTQVNTFKFIEEVHNCPAIWDVSSLAYNDAKNTKGKWRS